MRFLILSFTLFLGSLSAGFAGEEVTDKKFGFSLNLIYSRNEAAGGWKAGGTGDDGF